MRSCPGPAALLILFVGYYYNSLADAEQAGFPVRLVTGPGAEPYVQESDLPHGGPLTKMVSEAFALAGYDSSITFLPWKRGLWQLKAGAYDATFPYIATAERQAALLFSNPIATVETRIFQRSDGVPATSVQELIGQTFCLPLGYGVQAPLQALLEEERIRTEHARTLDSCFRMLQLGRVDFVPIDCRLGWYTIVNYRFDPANFRDDFILTTDTLHLVVDRDQPKSSALLQDFHKGWEQLKQSSDWEKLLQGLSINIDNERHCQP